jgi:hypothetical protein
VFRIRRPLALILASLAVAGGGVGTVVACQQSASPAAYVPFTGVTLQLSAVLGQLQCGTAANEVYKYTAVVWYAGRDGGPLGAPIASDVWDCFTEGVLENLPSNTDGGGDSFFLRVFAYSYAGTLAATIGEGGQGVQGTGDGAVSASVWCPGGLGPNGEPCPLQDASFADALGGAAQWSTTCEATETEGAPVTAICGPLALVAPAEALGTSDAASDAPSDAPAEAASAASDATGEASESD